MNIFRRTVRLIRSADALYMTRRLGSVSGIARVWPRMMASRNSSVGTGIRILQAPSRMTSSQTTATPADSGEEFYVAALEILNNEKVEDFNEKARLAVPLMRTAAIRGNQNAKYSLGVLLQSGVNGDSGVQEACKLFRELALSGHAQSQYNLAVLYLEGRGVSKNLTVALELFTMVVDEIPLAHNFIGQILMYQEKPALSQALDHFQKGAERGDPRAYVSLAHMYTHGKAVEVDYKKAFEYDKIAADKGVPIAQHNVATYYFLGKGTVQDYALSRHYFEMAADQGFTFAQVNLGNMYQQGLGCEKNLEKALHYYALASNENKHAESLMKAVQEKIDKEKSEASS